MFRQALPSFTDASRGNSHHMIGVALALIVVGVGLFFLVPFVGIPIGAVGLLLAVLYLVGFGRRAAEGTQP